MKVNAYLLKMVFLLSLFSFVGCKEEVNGLTVNQLSTTSVGDLNKYLNPDEIYVYTKMKYMNALDEKELINDVFSRYEKKHNTTILKGQVFNFKTLKARDLSVISGAVMVQGQATKQEKEYISNYIQKYLVIPDDKYLNKTLDEIISNKGEFSNK